MSNDFQIQVGGDFSELLRGFQQLEARAQQSGQTVGKGIAEGIQGYSSKSIAALQAELNRLQQRQVKLAIDSSAFDKTGEKIKQVQALLGEAQRRQLTVNVDDRSITGLQTRLAQLQAKQTRLDVDSTEFADAQRQINAVEKELTEISQRKVLIDADANSFLAVTTKLRSELTSLQQQQVKLDVDSQEFAALGLEIDRVESELTALERKRTQVNIDASSVTALQTKLTELQSRQTRISVDSDEFVDLQVQIDRVQEELAAVERKKVLINVDGNSITAITTRLRAELQSLEQQQVKVDVDSQEFIDLSQQIDRVGTELTALERRRLLVTADPSSIVALRSRLGELQSELERTQIGSQRFRELTKAIQETERELAKAGESADGLRLLDGVVQGIAFSLTNGLVNGAQQALAALTNLVNEFGRLDTELRKAAAAGGEAGGYDRLARAVDQVGIEAAGTQLEVAQLATELVRGGLTIEQTEASLAAIVRGAEATGTSFAQMGSVVSASLKGFGLEASESGRVVDALVQGANAAAADVTGMGNAFKYAAPVARILGVSIEDLGLTIGLLTNAGISAEEAGVTLRNGFSKLASAAPKAGGAMQDLTGQAAMAAKSMRSLNVDIFNTDGTLKPMEDTLLKLKGAFEKLDPATKIRLAANLFGGEDDGTKWLALLNQSEAEIRRMAKAMSDTKGAADTARDAMQGFELKLKQLDGTLGSIGNTFGSVAASALIPFIDAANLAAGVIAGLPGPVKALGAGLTLLAGAYVTAAVAQIAFTKAVATSQVQDAIAGVRALAGELRGRFLADVARANVAWAALRAGFTTTSTNAAVAGLAQVAQGLRNLNAAQAIAGFKALGAAMQAAAIQGKALVATQLAAAITGLRAGLGNAAAGALALGNSLRNTAAASAAAQAGLAGTALLLQQGMTTGATSAATAATGLSKVLAGLSGLTAGGAAAGLGSLAAGLGAAAVAAAPLIIAVGAIAAAAVGYNAAMSESRMVTETAGKAVADYGEKLRASGVAFQDFGKQGGPLQELFTSLKRNIDGFVQSLGELKIGGVSAKQSIEGFVEAVKILTGVKLIEWSGQAITAIKGLYAEFGKNLAIVESVDQFDQFQEQLTSAGEKATAFTAKLKELNSVPPDSIKAFTAEFNASRQALSDSLVGAENYKASLEGLISAAQAKTAATEQEKRVQQELISAYQSQLTAVNADIQLTRVQLTQLEEEALKRGLVVDKLKLQELSMAALAVRAKELSTAITSIGGDIQVGQSLQGLAQALGELEQSRFAITKARGEYELQQAQQLLSRQLEAAKARGASELQLNQLQQSGEAGLEAIRQRNRSIEAQALQARFTSLQLEQQLQVQLLALSQQKAANEANLAVNNAKIALLEAEKELSLEQNKILKDEGAIKAAQAKVGFAKESLLATQSNLSVLNQIQPLELQAAAAKGEAARNALIAEGAQKGLAVSTGQTAAYSRDLAAAAANTGVALGGAAASGKDLTTSAQGAATQTQNIATNAKGATTALQGGVTAATGVATGTEKAATGAKNLATGVNGATTAMQGTAKAAGGVEAKLDDATTAAGETSKATTGIGTEAKASADKTQPLLAALKDSATQALAVATADMAGNLSRASGSAGGLRNAMAAAATSAREFYNWLSQASGLPGSRWTGGPVEAGKPVRINDGPAGRSLGQESFLSAAGRLSLINKPANSIWSPPSSGIVIPAGVTDTLKARGVFESGRAVRAAVTAKPPTTRRGADGQLAATVAHQAVAIGKLEQAVNRLTDKDWNVQVRLRGDSSAPRTLNQLNRMR